MIPKVNLHTHTNFCDGRESAESMVKAAIAKDFVVLGFSGHSYTAHDEVYCMSKEGTMDYIAEVVRLQKQYEDEIQIYLGVEQDFYASQDTSGFQYAIGSVHYVEKDGIYHPVDESARLFQRAIIEGFGGDAYAFTKAYYETISQIPEKFQIDIIGHFDLVTKFNDEHHFFDPLDKRYQDAAFSAIEALVPYEKPFEINTGGVYRGLCSQPYPQAMLLKEILRQNGKITFSSDSHDGDSIGFFFEEAGKIAREVGFKSSFVWTPNGYEEVPL